MNSIEIHFQSSGGRIVGNGYTLLKNVVLALLDGWYVLTIKKVSKKISQSQRGYYFAVITEEYLNGAREEWGEVHDKNWAHDQLKQHLLFVECVNEKTGQVYKKVLSLGDLDTAQAEEYYENCRRLIFDYFAIVVALPNEQSNLNL